MTKTTEETQRTLDMNAQARARETVAVHARKFGDPFASDKFAAEASAWSEDESLAPGAKVSYVEQLLVFISATRNYIEQIGCLPEFLIDANYARDELRTVQEELREVMGQPDALAKKAARGAALAPQNADRDEFQKRMRATVEDDRATPLPRPSRDLHRETAAMLLGVHYNKVTDQQRNWAKQMRFLGSTKWITETITVWTTGVRTCAWLLTPRTAIIAHSTPGTHPASSGRRKYELMACGAV
jgi:hypothetical protein